MSTLYIVIKQLMIESFDESPEKVQHDIIGIYKDSMDAINTYNTTLRKLLRKKKNIPSNEYFSVEIRKVHVDECCEDDDDYGEEIAMEAELNKNHKPWTSDGILKPNDLEDLEIDSKNNSYNGHFVFVNSSEDGYILGVYTEKTNENQKKIMVIKNSNRPRKIQNLSK